MVETIFTSNLFVETILPFLLIFTVVFAILQKTQILGKEKKQIDAIVALVIGLIFVAFGRETDIVVRMIPILGVALVTILVFMILFGFLYREGDFKMPKGLLIGIGILIGILVLGTVASLTGILDTFLALVTGEGTSSFVTNAILLIIVIGAIATVVFWKSKPSEGGGDKGK